jgi:alpha/beta superfamily hydrolase
VKVSLFFDHNYEVLVFDFRKYGKSIRNFNEEKMCKDALATYNYLNKTFKEERIVVYGFSFGSTFATRIALRNKPKS